MKVNEQLVESVVKQVILEYGGVSNEIMQMSMLILNKIYEQQESHQGTEVNGNIIKGFYLDISDSEELMSITRGISVCLYLYDTNEVKYVRMKRYLNDNNLNKCSYSTYNKCIKLTFAWPMDGRIVDKIRNDMLSTINHEVKHAYQGSRNSNDNVTQQYINATKELGKGFGWNKEANSPLKKIIDYDVPWIYYKLDRLEIDAWMQEMYIQAQETNDIKQTKTYEMLTTILSDYNKLKDYYTSSDSYYTNQNIKQYIDNSIRRIDEPRNFFKVCDRNVDYLTTKMRRVIGRWYEEQGTYSGSFKNYASNEIQQGSPFKNRRSWRDMFKNFFNRKKNRQY